MSDDINHIAVGSSVLAEVARDVRKYYKDSELQPIETAPKDRDVLVYNSYTGWYRSRYREEHGKSWPLYNWNGRQGVWWPVPTHWRDIWDEEQTQALQKAQSPRS